MSDAPRPRFDMLRRFGNSASALRDAVQANADAKAEAEAELAACKLIHEDRCVMTKEYAQALRRALA